jgi:hypothetical protein
MLVGLGAVVGLAIGALIALALGRRDRRLRSRDDIAAAAEAPVLQSLFPQQPRTTKDWLEFFQSWQPSLTDRARFEGVLDDLDILDTVDGYQLRSSPASAAGADQDGALPVAERRFGLTVIALAGDSGGLTVAPELAVFAATLGLSVAFVVGIEHESTIALRTACTARDRRSNLARQNLLTYGRPPGVESEWTALTVTLVVVDPTATDLVDWSLASSSRVSPAETAVLAVSSGFAVAEELAVVTRSAARNLYPVIGVLVASPDPADKTTGQFPLTAGHHTPRELAFMSKVAR